LMASAFWVWQKVRWHLTGPLGNFYIVDGVLGIAFVLLLYRGFGGFPGRDVASERPERNAALKGFEWVMWLGIAVNLGFALPALFAPSWLGGRLHVTIISYTYVWLANAGMLLVQACLFYVPVANRYVQPHKVQCVSDARRRYDRHRGFARHLEPTGSGRVVAALGRQQRRHSRTQLCRRDGGWGYGEVGDSG